jgi:hypothetical protein
MTEVALHGDTELRGIGDREDDFGGASASPTSCQKSISRK